MGIKLNVPKLTDLKPRLTVIGVGGAGGNAVNNMIATGLHGVQFIVANTDAQALAASSCEMRIQLGVNLTEGLGAGSKPEIGQAAAEEAVEEIRAQITGSHMVFIAAGMGGGTGTGAAGVIARIAKELDILTVAIVTKPFQFEGSRRMRIAEAGIEELRKYVDTLIVIPNQNLFRIANERTTFAEAFVLADQVLYSGIACIVDLIVKEGLINLDFADVRTVLSGMGTAMMGTGEATGERRAIVAAEDAISNPLLDELTLRGAKGLLVSIIGGPDLTLYEVDEAASRVRQEVDAEANIIVGATFDESMRDRVRVSIVASGMAGPPGAAHPSHPGTQGYNPQPPYPGHQAQPAGHPSGRPQGEELAHALSRALGPADPGRGPQQPMQRGPQPQPGWNAPGGVVIEDGLDHLGSGHPPPLPAGPAPQPGQAGPAGFTPAPPQEVRRPPRRVPGIDEFPEIGQREYRAKSVPDHRPRPEQPEPRRMSLLERLSWRPRKPNANQPVSPPYPQAVRGPGSDPSDGPHGPRSAGSADPSGEARGDGSQVSGNQQNIERRRR